MVSPIIGGDICKQRLASRLILADPRELTHAEIKGLWRIFVAIGSVWENATDDSAGLKSSWLEFIKEKTIRRPSFIGEYVNALEVVDELEHIYGDEAFSKLFLDNGISLDKYGAPAQLDTRLAHAKYFVIDEFIRVQIVAGGFKNFISPNRPVIQPQYVVNYNGFIAGSRYNRIKPVRPYKETDL